MRIDDLCDPHTMSGAPPSSARAARDLSHCRQGVLDLRLGEMNHRVWIKGFLQKWWLITTSIAIKEGSITASERTPLFESYV